MADSPNTVVKSHVLRDYRFDNWDSEVSGRWSYRDLVADENYRTGWISFDSVTWNPDDRQLYCGLNSIDGDLLYRFDPSSEQFESLKAQQWTDPFDSKIHRQLLRNPVDGCFYFGTSLLHDIDQQHEAPGGKLVKFDPKTGQYDVLGIPFPHLYVQSINADFNRGILYAFTYPAEMLVRFDLATRKSQTLAYLGNAILFAQPHNGVVDKHGCLWGTYAETRAWDEVTGQVPIRIFKYDPDQDQFTWYEHGLSRVADKQQLLQDPPRPDVHRVLTETRHKEDYGFCDAMCYDGDRTIYAGTVAGVLCRIDIETAEVEKVAHVMSAGRFPAIALDTQGNLFGAGGTSSMTQLVRWNTSQDTIEDIGPIVDEQTGETPARVHDLTTDNEGALFLAENDNHHRSSYLWTVRWND